MNNIFEKISVTLILLKIFGIYFFCYLATNEKIAITHLWHAIEPQTMYHLIAKDKVAQSINQLSRCLISVSTDSKAHHPIRKA